MTSVFHRTPLDTYPTAVRGDGAYLIDAAGKRYLDASGGAAVSCLGHSDSRVIAAIKRQLDELPFAHTAFFTSRPAEELAEHLARAAPGDLNHVYFVSGGSEAVEAALKLARQYAVERGQPRRHRFIARRQSYHGNTLGALAVGGNALRRAQFAPLLVDVAHVAPCYEYRDRQPDESAAAYGQRLVAELAEAIARLGGDQVIAFVAETVGGATQGATVPVPGYLRGVRELCSRHGILLILDEVMCGMGRCGSLHACTAEGVTPDLLVVAKGLGGGYQPIGAVLAQQHIVDAITRGSGAFQHGHTYIGHAMACAAALAVQRVIRRDGLLARVQRQGDGLRQRLQAKFGAHPQVGDIRGRGLFQAIELVQDRARKQPFDPALRLHARIKACAMAEGLMVYPMGGTIDGRHGDHVLLAPPFIVDDDALDQIVQRLARAVDAALAEALR